VEDYVIYTIGHKLVIDEALELAEKVLILVGSSQESKTLRNPFDADFRINLIKKVYQNNKNIQIEKLDDLTNEYNITYEWGQYVKDNTQKYTGRYADLIISGNDEMRKGWFSEEQMKNTTEVLIDRRQINISASELRGYILLNDKSNWIKYVPKEIYNDFDTIKQKLLEVKEYKEILNKIEDNKTIENFKQVYKIYEEKDKNEKLKNI